MGSLEHPSGILLGMAVAPWQLTEMHVSENKFTIDCISRMVKLFNLYLAIFFFKESKN